jgi:hypothetical protein
MTHAPRSLRVAPGQLPPAIRLPDGAAYALVRPSAGRPAQLYRTAREDPR